MHMLPSGESSEMFLKACECAKAARCAQQHALRERFTTNSDLLPVAAVHTTAVPQVHLPGRPVQTAALHDLDAHQTATPVDTATHSAVCTLRRKHGHSTCAAFTARGLIGKMEIPQACRSGCY
jgi:hypothetical protein